MSEHQHTPGPWVGAEVGGYTEIRTANDDATVGAIVYNTAGDYHGDEMRDWYAQRSANASLIIAAPDMLEALLIVKTWFEPGFAENPIPKHDAEVADKIYAAIAKATGAR